MKRWKVLCRCGKTTTNKHGMCWQCGQRKTPLPAGVKSTADGTDTYDYSDDEIEFLRAMDLYKREKSRPFPTWCEVLEVVRSLGYRKEQKKKDVSQ